MIFKNCVFCFVIFYEYNKISKWKICNLYRWLYLPLLFTWRMGKRIFIDLHKRKELRCGECLAVCNSIPQLCWCPSQTQVRVQRLIKLEHLDLVSDWEHLQPLQHFSVKHFLAINHFICKLHDYILLPGTITVSASLHCKQDMPGHVSVVFHQTKFMVHHRTTLRLTTSHPEYFAIVVAGNRNGRTFTYVAIPYLEA